MRLSPRSILLTATLALAAIGSAGASPPTRLMSDAPSANGGALCLAVDAGKLLKGPFAAVVAPGSPARSISGPFYPVVVAPCDQIGQDMPATWNATDTRELRVGVRGQSMCLTARPMAGFLPLVDAFLDVFKASAPGSAFAYLAEDLKPAGVANARRLDMIPELLVGPCGLPDAQDFWVYDDPSGTISSPAGLGRRRLCVTIHVDRKAPAAAVTAGAPAGAYFCPDSPNTAGSNIATLDRASLPPHQRWRIETGKEFLPTYAPRDPRDYFSGKHGLPIAGPLGRCLSADVPSPSAVTSDCDGRAEQDWIYIEDTIKLSGKQQCLSAGANGAVALVKCSGGRDQLWAYTVRDSEASKAWLNADLFGQIRPVDDPLRCLAVAEDPFKDTMRQRNPVRLLDCAAALPRQMSWFIPTKVSTVRVELIRYGHEPDHMPLGKRTDDEVKAVFSEQMTRLSEQYRRIGVRFVFDPEHDFKRIDDPAADDPKNAQSIADAVTRIAAGEAYGKLVVALTERGLPGAGGALNAEYEPARIVDLVTGARFDFTRWSQNPARIYDKAGLPALSYFIDFGAAAVGFDLGASLSQTQAFGHYFGLNFTFGPDEFADTPEDINPIKPWLDAGAPPCGNLRSLTLAGKIIAPDRSNNESVWRCEIGRSLNALTPMQLAKASWVLRNQLNRIPLTACGPPSTYNADVVTCENEASLALCKETSAFLAKSRHGAALNCSIGGPIGASIKTTLLWGGMQFVLKSTPEGQALISALAGTGRSAKPVTDQAFADIQAAFGANKNPVLAQALLNRLAELREMGTRDHSLVYEHIYSAKPEHPITPAEFAALRTYATRVLTPDFIANVPALMK